MVTKELVERINELARKQRTLGLTPEEKEEQSRCRQQYIEAFKTNLKATLDKVKVVTPEEYEAYMAGKAKGCSCGCHDHSHNHSHDHTDGNAKDHGPCNCKH